MLRLAVQNANLEAQIRVLNKKAASNAAEAGLPDQENKSRAEAAAAYQEWRRLAIPIQLVTGKKLYSAWLTYADGLVACYLKCDPEDVDQGPYGVAWHQARNEFEVDTQ